MKRKSRKRCTKDQTSLVVQWLRLLGCNTGGLGLIPSLGTRFHMPQQKSHMLQKKIKDPACHN